MIRLFGSKSCAGCSQAKALLEEKGIEYEYIDIYDGNGMADYQETTAGSGLFGIPLLQDEQELRRGLKEIKDKYE